MEKKMNKNGLKKAAVLKKGTMLFKHIYQGIKNIELFCRKIVKLWNTYTIHSMLLIWWEVK